MSSMRLTSSMFISPLQPKAAVKHFATGHFVIEEFEVHMYLRSNAARPAPRSSEKPILIPGVRDPRTLPPLMTASVLI